MPEPISRLADFQPYLLAVTSNAISRRIADIYEQRFGLSIPEWGVMAVLGDAGPRTQRQLVGATVMDKVAVNRACKRLEERGLLLRHPNARDGRSHLLELSVEGQALHREIMEIALATEARLFAVLAPEEQARLKAMLQRLREAARGAG